MDLIRTIEFLGIADRDKIDEFKKYFTNTWLGTKESPAQYSIEQWSYLRMTTDDMVRANNAVEAFNLELQNALGVAGNPSVSFIFC